MHPNTSHIRVAIKPAVPRFAEYVVMYFARRAYDDIFARFRGRQERENGSAGVISAQNHTPLNDSFKGILGDVRGGISCGDCAGIIVQFDGKGRCQPIR